jgi:hypothetical protein
VLGFRFSDQATNNWTEVKPFVRENRFIQVDIEADEIGRKHPVEVALVGDVRETVRDLIEALRSATPVDRTEWLDLVQRTKAAFVLDVPETTHPDGLEPMPVIRELRAALPANAIVASDTGDHQHYFGTGPYPALRGGRFLNRANGRPAVRSSSRHRGQAGSTIGACVAVTGDGSFADGPPKSPPPWSGDTGRLAGLRRPDPVGDPSRSAQRIPTAMLMGVDFGAPSTSSGCAIDGALASGRPTTPGSEMRSATRSGAIGRP